LSSPAHHHLTLSSSSLPTSPPPFYPLSLHDALPIFLGIGDRSHRACLRVDADSQPDLPRAGDADRHGGQHLQHAEGLAANLHRQDRKSTRLNSSHVSISYAVFCLKKKKKKKKRKKYI